jgi:hypothetical protein
MAVEPYKVLEIHPEQVLEPEALGSKEKFWCRPKEGPPDWLFKFPQPNTGQHWAEKIAAEIAACLGILHARVELALFQNQQGSVTESFARGPRELYHGNQVLAGKVLTYDPARRFRHHDHTLVNIFLALERMFLSPDSAERVKTSFAGYLVLDALIGNTDRHHENWGILRRQVGGRWRGHLAPTFDHASSLGRELRDIGEGKTRTAILGQGRIRAYAEKAPGAIFWATTDKRGLSPLELVRRATARYPAIFRPALARLARLDNTKLGAILAQVPEDWMTPVAREFAATLVDYNLTQLRILVP